MNPKILDHIRAKIATAGMHSNAPGTINQLPSQMIIRHFETRAGWKFTDYLNTERAILRRAHKRFKIRNKNKDKKPRKKGANKKENKNSFAEARTP